jgi:ABC-type oligopeptide transport system substrate-binding subunit
VLFDPGVLPARAVDPHTLEIDVERDAAMKGDAALLALSAAVMRPVPARNVEELGIAWAAPERIVTSGAFLLGTVNTSRHQERVVLIRSDAPPGSVARLTLTTVRTADVALRRVRAGELDALMDGMIPPDLLPSVRRFADWRDGPAGGALVALEVQGFSPARLELTALKVEPPP